MPPPTPPSYTSLHTTLLTYPPPLLCPSKPHSTSLTRDIASAALHPTLEAALHLLNADLPSAHFLVRHMQSPPALEGMFLHGILHRIEGDFDNSRMWYSDVLKGCLESANDDKAEKNEVYQKIWGGEGKGFKALGEEIKEVPFGKREEYGYGGSKEGELNEGQRFLNRVQKFKIMKAAERSDEEKAKLEEESRREIEGVLEWCVKKFGDGVWEDARDAWVDNSEEISKMSEDQTLGDSGHRKF